MNGTNKKGFTLIEIMVVIIIIGVLASLALPRLFKTVELSRAAEAQNALGVMRGAMERCILMRSDDTNCTLANLDVDDPGNEPNAKFTYAVTAPAAATATGYSIVATRNGSTASTITLTRAGTAVTITGAGNYTSIGN